MSQHDFLNALLDPDRPVPSGLVDPHGRPAGRRFNVYRNNVAVGLTDALSSYFPVTHALVGEAFFRAMAGVFLRTYPPQSPVLIEYGLGFPDFLEGFPPVAHLGYLPDVARLEVAIRASYHAADAAPIDPARLTDLAPDHLAASRITLAPATRLVSSDWPIHAIWSANTRQTPPPAVKTPEHVLVCRPEFDPEPVLIGAPAASFTAAILRGDVLANAVENCGPALDLSATLALLLSHGTITGIIRERIA